MASNDREEAGSRGAADRSPVSERAETKSQQQTPQDEQTCSNTNYPGGGGDDAVCFTAGAAGAYFGAGVILAYLAARRKPPAVVAGISAGAINAAAMQRCYQNGKQIHQASSSKNARGETVDWPWFRRYVHTLTERPLGVVWDALPDLSDFFADMPPVRDTSAPPHDETKARRQKYALIQLGRLLARLPISIRSVAETIVYYIRAREGYGHFSWVRFSTRLAYLITRVSAPVAAAFYRELPAVDKKRPRVYRPLFGKWVCTIAASLVATRLVFIVVAIASIPIFILRYVALPNKHQIFVAILSFLALSLVVWASGIWETIKEDALRTKFAVAAKLVSLWSLFGVLTTELLRTISSSYANPVFPKAALYAGLVLGVLLFITVFLALFPAIVAFRKERKPGSKFRRWIFTWAPGVLLKRAGLSESLIDDFYIMQKLKHLFDPNAEQTGGYKEPLSDDPMPILLVSAPLQSVPIPGTDRIGSQQVWPKPGADLVESLRASIALPGLMKPIHIPHEKLSYWIDQSTIDSNKISELNLVDGCLIRQNPLPALLNYLNMHKEVARKLERDKSEASIHVVFSVPLEPQQPKAGTRHRPPSNIVDVGLLSMKLARRRDTKVEVQQTNHLSGLEKLILESGGSGSRQDAPHLNVLPLIADCIAPEADLDIGAALSPDRDKALAVIAAGCKQTLQRLYAQHLPREPQVLRCRDLLSTAWRSKGCRNDVPDPAGLPEVCAVCNKYLCQPAARKRDRLNLSPLQFPQLTGKEPRIIFLASGGVFRGAFQVGVLAALLKAKIKVDLAVGASVGTLMGGALAAAFHRPPQDVGEYVSKLVKTFLEVDKSVALTAALKAATREVGIRGRAINLSPRDVQRMIRRGSRYDAGYAVTGAPPAFLDALSTMFVLPYENTKRIAAEFVAGHITSAFTDLLHGLRKETLWRLGIQEYLMGVSLLQQIVEQLLCPDKIDRISPQPYLKDGRGIALFGTTTDLTTWQSKLLGDPQQFGGRFDLIEAVLSSSAFPAVFQPRREADVYPGCGHPDVLYADGGMFDNLPFIPAITVLASVQSNSIPDGLNEAFNFLKLRHDAPDLFIVGSLEAGTDPNSKTVHSYDSILSVRNRARELNANLKISDFEFTSIRVHDQVERLLKGTSMLPPNAAGLLNSVVDAAVLPVYPMDDSYLNHTFAFCRTFGLEASRIQLTVSHGCFQTLAAIARAQAFRPPKHDCSPETYDPIRWEARSSEELLSKSIWAQFLSKKVPWVTKGPGPGCSRGQCPFFRLEYLEKNLHRCLFAGNGVEEVYETCCRDTGHQKIAEMEEVAPPDSILKEFHARHG